MTPLLLACMRGYNFETNEFLAKFSKVRAEEPVYISTSYLCTRLILNKMRFGFKINQPLEPLIDEEDYTPLHWAFRKHDFILIALLLHENPLQFLMIDREGIIPFDLIRREKSDGVISI